MLAIAIKNKFSVKPEGGLGLVYVGLAIWFLPGYFMWDANGLLGLLLLPFVCTPQAGKYSLKFLVPAVISAALAFLLPVNTLLFITMMFAVLLLAENSYGNLGNMPLLVTLLISPVFNHVTRLFEFPVRLWLTERVASSLAVIGMKATAAGNMITIDGYEFSVDPACAGLNMLVLSLLTALFITAFYQKQTAKRARATVLAFVLIITIALNVCCNFFRILLLVALKIMPGTVMHDLMGIICLALYVMLPLIIFIKPLLNKFGRQQAKPADQPVKLRFAALHALLLVVVASTAFRLVRADDLEIAPAMKKVPGYQTTILKGGITKFHNQQALVYLKPTAFYAPEHDPMVCWTGSGYKFTTIKKEQISGREIYTALLKKGADLIYAAWWFDDGSNKTISQFSWRWDAAMNKHNYFLVNVNAASQLQLRSLIQQTINDNNFINTKIK